MKSADQVIRSNQRVRDKIEGSNGGEIGDPDMFAERNIEAMLTKIGYRNVMSRQAQQLKEIMRKSTLRKEEEMAIKRARQRQTVLKKRIKFPDGDSGEHGERRPHVVVQDGEASSTWQQLRHQSAVRPSNDAQADDGARQYQKLPRSIQRPAMKTSMDARPAQTAEKAASRTKDLDAALIAAENLKKQRQSQ